MQNKIYKIICCIIISCFYCTIGQAADNVYTQTINIGSDDTEYNPVPIEIIEPANEYDEDNEVLNPVYIPYPYYVPQPYYYPVPYYNNPHFHGGIYYPSTGFNVHTHSGNGYNFRAANWNFKPMKPHVNKRPPNRPHHPPRHPR